MSRTIRMSAVMGLVNTPDSELRGHYASDKAEPMPMVRRKFLIEVTGIEDRFLDAAITEAVSSLTLDPKSVALLQEIKATKFLTVGACGPVPDTLARINEEVAMNQMKMAESREKFLESVAREKFSSLSDAQVVTICEVVLDRKDCENARQVLKEDKVSGREAVFHHILASCDDLEALVEILTQSPESQKEEVMELPYMIRNMTKKVQENWSARFNVLKYNPNDEIRIVTSDGNNAEEQSHKASVLAEVFRSGLVIYGPDKDPNGKDVFRDAYGYGPIVEVPNAKLIIFKINALLFRSKEEDSFDEPVSLDLKENQLGHLEFVHRLNILGLSGSRRVSSAYTDEGKLAAWMTPDESNFLSHLRDQGYEFTYSSKIMKRIKGLLTLYLLRGRLSSLDVHVIEDSALEKVMDGAFVIKASTFKKMLRQFVVDKNNKRRGVRQLRRLKKAVIFSARLFGPIGMIKGHMFVVPDELWRFGDHDVVTHRANVKKEIRFTKGWTFGFNPHLPKKEAYTNVQYLINMGFLRDELPTIIKNFFRQGIMDIKKKGTMETEGQFEAATMEIEDENVKGDLGFSAYLHYRGVAQALKKAGLTISHSRLVRKMVFEALVKKLTDGKDKIHLPIACSRYCQIISRTMATMAGCNVNVNLGEILWVPEIYCCVVSDEDWVDMLPRHGGCDMDDYFAVIYRVIDGIMKAVVLRTPNGPGDFSIFTAIGETPTSKVMDTFGNESEICQIEATVKEIPSDVRIREGLMNVRDISFTDPYNGEMSRKLLHHKLLSAMEGLNPGLFINTVALAEMAGVPLTGDLSLPCSMEKAIDLPTQSGISEIQEVFQEFCTEVVGYISDQNIPIDLRFLMSRFPLAELCPNENGFITKAYRLIAELTGMSWKWLEDNVPYLTPPQVFGAKLTEEQKKSVESTFRWMNANYATQNKEVDYKNNRRLLRDHFFERLGKCGPIVECVRYLSELVYTRTKKDGKPYSDAILVLDPVWPIYRAILFGVENVLSLNFQSQNWGIEQGVLFVNDEVEGVVELGHVEKVVFRQRDGKLYNVHIVSQDDCFTVGNEKNVEEMRKLFLAIPEKLREMTD